MKISSTPARQKLYEMLEPSARAGNGLSLVNRVIIAVIIFASIVAILETEAAQQGIYENLFWNIELLIVAVCGFQTKVATDSRRSLPPIPREGCH